MGQISCQDQNHSYISCIYRLPSLASSDLKPTYSMVFPIQHANYGVIGLGVVGLGVVGLVAGVASTRYIDIDISQANFDKAPDWLRSEILD